MMLKNYISRHLQASLNSLMQLSRAPFTSIMTCLVIGITLALPMALFVVLKNVENISKHFQQTSQLTLYLKKSVSASDALALTHGLQNQSGVTEAHAVSPEQGLKELTQQAGFENAISELQTNPLPWAIVILPAPTSQPNTLEILTQHLKKLPEVDTIQFDMLWAKRLATFVTLAQRALYALAIFLGVAVLLLINNAIRTATQNNQKEIEVIKLIGGTHAFIRRPFLYAGMIYGLLGGIIAWQLVDIFLLWLKAPINHLVQLYNSQFQVTGIGFSNTLILLGCSVALGFIGSWFAVNRHFKHQN